MCKPCPARAAQAEEVAVAEAVVQVVAAWPALALEAVAGQPRGAARAALTSPDMLKWVYEGPATI